MHIPLGHRFVLLSLFYLQVGLVWLLLWITPGFHERGERAAAFPRWRPALAWCAIAVILGSMVVHNFRRANARLQREVRKSTPAERTAVVDTARRVADLAGPGAVILGDREVTWPLPTFGVRIIAHLHLNPLVPDWHRRIHDVRDFFKVDTSDARRDEIVRRYGASHVIVRGAPPESLVRWLGEVSTDRQPLPGRLELFSLR